MALILFLSTVANGEGPSLEDLDLPPIRGQVAIDDPSLRENANAEHPLELDETDLYSILGIARTAEMKEVKAAYRQLVKRLHPDLYQDRNNTRDRQFVQVQNAYDILSDPQLRAEYDKAALRGYADHFAQDPRAYRPRDDQYSGAQTFADVPFEQIVQKRGRYAESMAFHMPYIVSDQYFNQDITYMFSLRMYTVDILKNNRFCQLMTAAGLLGGVCVAASGGSDLNGLVAVGGAVANLGLVWARLNLLTRTYMDRTAKKFKFYLDAVVLDENKLMGFKRNLVAFDLLEAIMSERMEKNHPKYGRNVFAAMRMVAKRLPHIHQGLLFRYLNGDSNNRPWVASFEASLKSSLSKPMWQRHALAMAKDLAANGHLSDKILDRARSIFGAEFATDIAGKDRCELSVL